MTQDLIGVTPIGSGATTVAPGVGRLSRERAAWVVERLRLLAVARADAVQALRGMA